MRLQVTKTKKRLLSTRRLKVEDTFDDLGHYINVEEQKKLEAQRNLERQTEERKLELEMEKKILEAEEEIKIGKANCRKNERNLTRKECPYRWKKRLLLEGCRLKRKK